MPVPGGLREPKTLGTKRKVIAAAIEVHRTIGPGLFESVYHECLPVEFATREIPFATQVAVPVVYRSVTLPVSYRIDFLIADQLVLEIKAIERLLPVHDQQLLTYMRLLGKNEGLLINFNVPVLKTGVRRLLL